MTDQANLSERETEILRLVATGASNKEIARALVISPNTVKVHLRNIFAKVGVASRTEATLYALRTGLLPAPASSPANQPNDPEALLDGIEESTGQPAETALHAPEDSSHPIVRRTRGRLGLLALAMLALAGVVALILRPAAPPAPVESSAPTPAAAVRWSSQPDLPVALSDPAGAVYNNTIYLLAGEERGRTWAFDLYKKQWQPRAAKPTPVTMAGAALLGERIYVPGGRQADGSPSDRLEIYDPRQDAWSAGSPLPRGLYGYALAALEGRLYLFGGTDGKQPLATAYRYDPDLDAWEPRSDLPQPCMLAGAAALNGKILLAGGWDGRQPLDAAAWYYPSRDRPGETPWEPAPALPQPRSAMGMAALADLVYIVGGEGDDPAGDLPPLELSAAGGAWVPFDAPPHPAGAHLLLLPADTRLHALGDGTVQHQSYQAIYNVVFPVIQ